LSSATLHETTRSQNRNRMTWEMKFIGVPSIATFALTEPDEPD
jgi:hypothetical protein